MFNKPGSPRCCRAVAPSPSPPSSLSPGCVGLGAEQLFWRLPDNSALYLPPVPPNTLVSAAALCCKFPWSNYVLIYDNPGRAVEGGKRQSSLEVARRGPGCPPLAPADCELHTLDRELLHPGGWGEEHPRAGNGAVPGGNSEWGHVGLGFGVTLECRSVPSALCPIRQLGVILG